MRQAGERYRHQIVIALAGIVMVPLTGIPTCCPSSWKSEGLLA